MLAPVLDWQNMLPDGVFKNYVDVCSRVTEAYPEYNYMGMINVLSILSGRKFCFYLPWEDLHEQNTSFYLFMLGLSSAKKSTAMNRSQELLKMVLGDKKDKNMLFDDPCHKIPKNFSKESFEVELCNNEMPNAESASCGYLNYDECVSLMQSMNARGGYNAGFRDKLCEFYDGKEIEIIRKDPEDRTKNVTIKSDKKTRLGLWFSTTFSSFEENTYSIDMKSGYLLRFLFATPQYEQKRINDRDISKSRAETYELASKLIKIYDKWEKAYEANGKKPIELMFSAEQTAKIDDWYHETQDAEKEDDLTLSYIAKLQTYMCKLSVLFHVSNEDWNPNDLTIDDDSFEKAFNLCVNFHLPTYTYAASLVSSNPSAMQTRIIKKLQSSQGQPISHQTLTRFIQPKNKKEFNESISMLENDMHLIDVFTNENNTVMYKLHDDNAFSMDMHDFDPVKGINKPKTIEITF